jgi:hypothetical protein
MLTALTFDRLVICLLKWIASLCWIRGISVSSNETIFEISLHIKKQFGWACQAAKLHGVQATPYLFICLFNDASSSFDCIVSNGMTNKEWIRMDVGGYGSGLISDTIPALFWVGWGKSQNPKVRIVGVLAKIQTRHIQNTSQKHYRLSKLF